MPRPLLPLALCALVARAAPGCAALDASGETGDTGYCSDAPKITWDSFGQGFLVENCQSCHASGAPERNGAPEGIVFDTEADVATQVNLILAVSTGDATTMPPEGGVSDDDRYLLELWLTCFPPTP